MDSLGMLSSFICRDRLVGVRFGGLRAIGFDAFDLIIEMLIGFGESVFTFSIVTFRATTMVLTLPIDQPSRELNHDNTIGWLV